ncbi:Uncharacterised protein [uncultured archaeon]|nr:Uncharacterised protein [uncultured archaeon]
MVKNALFAALLALLLLASFGCTSSFRNEAARLPAPPGPPQPPIGAKAKGETQVFTVAVPKNVAIPNSSGLPQQVISAKPNANRANDTSLISEPAREIPINDTDAVLAGLFGAQHPERLQVYFFFSPMCPYSSRVKPQADSLEEEYKNSTEWHNINVLEPEGYAFFEKTAREKGLPRPGMVVPLVFIGKYRLTGVQEITELLPKVLQNSTS